MAKYIFWFYMYMDVKRRKGIFNLKTHIPQLEPQNSCLILVLFSLNDLPKSFSSNFSLEILRYYLLTTPGPVCNGENLIKGIETLSYNLLQIERTRDRERAREREREREIERERERERERVGSGSENRKWMKWADLCKNLNHPWKSKSAETAFPKKGIFYWGVGEIIKKYSKHR